MAFSSLLFVYLFLPLFLICHTGLKNMAVKNAVLLAFSLFFYAWGQPMGVLLLAGTALADWRITTRMQHARGKGRKLWLLASVVMNLGLLGFFKYGGFLTENIGLLTGRTLSFPALSLPLGISFYTFQAIAYAADVYRGRVQPPRSYARYLLHQCLFARVSMGPIVRYGEIEGMLDARTVTLSDLSAGLFRFMTGLAKKAVFAGTAGKLAAQYMDAPAGSIPVAAAWFGVLMYAFQIYFDFSGYTDMALGVARMAGIRLPENFRHPYAARSASDFWRRWHITLGAFFRDYVYIPLGGNRRRQYLNLAVVWLLTGLWHGASWNFVLWGAYYGVLIAIERLFLRKWLERLPHIVSHIYLPVLTLCGWVLFYFSDIGTALAYLRVMFFAGGVPLTTAVFNVAFMNNIFFTLAALFACLPIGKWMKARLLNREGRYAPAVLHLGRALLGVMYLALSTAMLAGESYSAFLYAQF